MVFVQRFLQREIQIILLLLTKKPNLAIGIFSILLLPGVFIHEVSHLFMAIILRVPVRKISLFPQVTKKGKIRLGFVETAKSNVLRDSLIGLAPFIAGLFLVAYIGSIKLGFITLIEAAYDSNLNIFLSLLNNLPKTTDFGLWIYFAFAISSTMLPSESDRQSWTVIVILIVIVLSFVLLSGLGEWMLNNIYPFFNQWLMSISTVLTGSVIVDLLIFIPAWIVRQIITKITGLRVV